MEIDYKEPYISLPDQLTELSREFYTNLPYHNFDHALEVYDEAMRLTDLCTANGVAVNRRVVAAAALLHDANFHIDSSGRFKTKEEYSIYIARHTLPFYSYSPDEIIEVETSISGTELGARCPTTEAKILRRADIGNVARTRREFLSKTLAFTREEIQIKGLSGVDWGSIVNKTRFVFDKYLQDEDLRLGDFDTDRDGVLGFIADCVENIDGMARETYQSLCTIGREAVENVLGQPEDKSSV